jgi:hypothetical protein
MSIISKGDFSKLAGISKSTVSKLIARGRIPETDGGIDVSTPEVKSYLEFRNRKSEPATPSTSPQSKPKNRKSTPKKKPEPLPEAQDDDEITAGMKSKTALEIQKLAAQARHLELKNGQIERRLVAREVVKNGIFVPIETMFVRLLSEGSKTIAAKVHPMIKGGAPVEEIEEEVRKRLTAFIRPAKAAMKKALQVPKA